MPHSPTSVKRKSQKIFNHPTTQTATPHYLTLLYCPAKPNIDQEKITLQRKHPLQHLWTTPSFVRYLLIIQITLLISITAFWSIHSLSDSRSVLLGGIAALIPNLYFAWRFLSCQHHDNPKHIVRAVYIAEMIKLALCVFLSLLIFRKMSVTWLPFMCGLVSVYFAHWLVPILAVLIRKRTTSS